MRKKAEAIVAACQTLPTVPAIALEVLRLSRDEEVDLRQIADVLSRDVALSGRILRVCNSSFYGLSRKVGTVSQAVVMLGLANVKTLALGFSLMSDIARNGAGGMDMQAYWRRSLHQAVAARTFAEQKLPVLREEAFTAGLLADVGLIAMNKAFGEDCEPFCIGEHADHVNLYEKERELLQTDHQEVGAVMADSWHLPELLVVSIANHHFPDRCGDVDPMVSDLARIVFMGNLCAEAMCGSRTKEAVEQFEEAAREYLGLERDPCRLLVENLHRDAQEAGNLLEIDLPEGTSYAEIVQQANEELTRLTLQSQQQAEQIERRQREAASRLEKLEQANRALAQNANQDPLTGVYNRRFMEAFLEREIARAQRFSRSLSVLFIDVDHFKEVNDRYGHQVGDTVLQQIAQLLKAGTREVDCLCRFGGEEFVMTLPETDLMGANQLAEKIRRLIAAWKFNGAAEETLRVTVSIGVAAMNPSRPMDKDILLQIADESVYSAKREGRNCVCSLRKRVTPREEAQSPS